MEKRSSYHIFLARKVVSRMARYHQTQRAYASLYRLVRLYNSRMPFHKNTGERFSKEERIEFQQKNIAMLEEIAKAKHLDSNVTFNLKRDRYIRMHIGKRLYPPR